MADIQLEQVNNSGELVAIKLGGTEDGKSVLIKDKLGGFVFEDVVTNFIANMKLGTNNNVFIQFSPSTDQLDLKTLYGTSDADSSFLSLLNSQVLLGTKVNSESIEVLINSANGIRLVGQTLARIEAGTDDIATTKEYVLSKFAGWSFDGITITAPNGILVEIEDGEMTINPDLINLTIAGDFVNFSSTISNIDSAGDKSAVTKEWVLARSQQTADKGSPNGYAPLDTNAKVPAINLPSSTVFTPADDPGDSTATSIGELVADYNQLLANLRAAGNII